MRSVPSSGPSLSGIARTERAAAWGGRRARSIAGAVLALSGCAPTEEGIVLEGADGEKYVMPDDARAAHVLLERGVHRRCDGADPAAREPGRDHRRQPRRSVRILGCATRRATTATSGSARILFAGSRWNSPAVAGWANVPSGGFAAPGSKLQSDVVTPAPAGATTGQRAPLKGGFGSSGKSGFGSAVGGGSSVGG